MRKYMAQKCRRESLLFSQSLNSIVEDVPVEAHPFLIQRSCTEHIDTIPDLHAHRVRKDIQHQIIGTNDVATRDSLVSRNSSAKAFPLRPGEKSSVLPALPQPRLRWERWRNRGQRYELLGSRPALPVRLGQSTKDTKTRTSKIHECRIACSQCHPGATLLPATGYLNAQEMTSWPKADDELNCLTRVAYGWI
jgi:hypothetical protein